jgi:hypothetical protein
MNEVKSLKEIVTQLRSCGFTCEAGPLENNVDFQLLEEIAGCKEKTIREALIEAGNILRKNFATNPFAPKEQTPPIPLTHPQDIRDEIIEKAKCDIVELKCPGELFGKTWEYREKLTGYSTLSRRSGNAYNCEYVVNRERNTVVALLRGYNSSEVMLRGIAKCGPSDCFNVHIGKAIALRRALGLEVPSEYLNAPQPTEVRVGDVVIMREDAIPHVVDVGGCDFVTEPIHNIDLSYAIEHVKIILDDSRE